MPPESSSEYMRRHKDVYKARGKAIDYKCVDCGKKAREWSTVRGTDGSDPHAHYEPRCVPCHTRYDDKAAKVSAAQRGTTRSVESNEKRSKTLTGRTLSEEHRRKIAESRRGSDHTPRTEEYREKMSKALKGRVFSEEHKRKLREAAARRKEQRGDPGSNGK